MKPPQSSLVRATPTASEFSVSGEASFQPGRIVRSTEGNGHAKRCVSGVAHNLYD